MDNIVKVYELPMLTSALKETPKVLIEDLNYTVQISGWNLEDEEKEVTLKFKVVLCYSHTSECFTKSLLNAYDSVVEIKESEWLKELEIMNVKDFESWKPRHFAIYLDGAGMYQFIAQEFEVI